MNPGIIDKLTDRLKHELPGTKAQLEMTPDLKDVDLSKMRPDGSSQPGGVLLLLYPHNGEMYLPLMLRPDYGGPHSGQVSFPGGKKEDGDTDLIQTALRESQEELGILSSDVHVIGKLTKLFIAASNFDVLPVVGFSESKPKFVVDPREVREVIEVPISHLLDPKNKNKKPFKVSAGFTINAPYYAIREFTVWGATAMMLSEFLTVYKDL